MTASFDYELAEDYAEFPRTRQKTFVLKSDDYELGAQERDKVLNDFMDKKEVLSTHSTVLVKEQWIIFVDTVVYAS